jgi:hypothetical protein
LICWHDGKEDHPLFQFRVSCEAGCGLHWDFIIASASRCPISLPSFLFPSPSVDPKSTLYSLLCMCYSSFQCAS